MGDDDEDASVTTQQPVPLVEYEDIIVFWKAMASSVRLYSQAASHHCHP